jgi:hypothetical protein
VVGAAADGRASGDPGCAPGVLPGRGRDRDVGELSGVLRGIRAAGPGPPGGRRADAAQRRPGPGRARPGGRGRAGAVGGRLGRAVRRGAGGRFRVPGPVRTQRAGAGGLAPAAAGGAGRGGPGRARPGDGARCRRGRGADGSDRRPWRPGLAELHHRRRAHPGRPAAGPGVRRRRRRSGSRGGGGQRGTLLAAGRAAACHPPPGGHTRGRRTQGPVMAGVRGRR